MQEKHASVSVFGSRIHRSTLVVCFQKSWINENTDDDLVRLVNIQCVCQDGVQWKKTGVSVTGHIEFQWSGSSGILYTSYGTNVDCVFVKCTQNFPIILHDSLHVNSFCPINDDSLLQDIFTRFIVDDFDHGPHLLLTFCLTDLCISEVLLFLKEYSPGIAIVFSQDCMLTLNPVTGHFFLLWPPKVCQVEKARDKDKKLHVFSWNKPKLCVILLISGQRKDKIVDDVPCDSICGNDWLLKCAL